MRSGLCFCAQLNLILETYFDLIFVLQAKPQQWVAASGKETNW